MSHLRILKAAACLSLTLVAAALQAAQAVGTGIGQVVRPVQQPATARPLDASPPKTKPVPISANRTTAKTGASTPRR